MKVRPAKKDSKTGRTDFWIIYRGRLTVSPSSLRCTGSTQEGDILLTEDIQQPFTEVEGGSDTLTPTPS